MDERAPPGSAAFQCRSGRVTTKRAYLLMPLWANGHKDSFLAQASRKTASKLALLALGNAGGADGAASEPSAARQTNEVSPKGERSESMPRSQGLPGV